MTKFALVSALCTLCLICTIGESATSDIDSGKSPSSNETTTETASTLTVDERLTHLNSVMQASNSSESKARKVILILADGVRWDYVNQDNLPGFDRLLKRGVKAEYVQPIFPAYSYPNWYTIVTGNLSRLQSAVQSYLSVRHLDLSPLGRIVR
jgi:hypothetical protein